MYWLTKNKFCVLGTFNFCNRSEWEGDIAPYSPRFQDGWSPGIISFFDDDNFDFGLDKNEDFVLSNMSKDRVKRGAGGLHSTEVYLPLTQQPQVQFSVFPSVFS